MTNQQAREVFNTAARVAASPDAIARIEFLREYFCNPEFRAWVQQRVWEINSGKAQQ